MVNDAITPPGPASPVADADRMIRVRGPHRLAAGIVIVAWAAGSLALFTRLWQRDASEDLIRQPGGWAGALLMVAGGAAVHELLHALGWVIFARAPWRSLSVRRSWRVMGFIAHSRVALPADGYRLGLALPALILGGGAIALGCRTGNGLYTLWSLFFLLECYSDLALLFALRPVPAHVRLLGQTGALECRIIASAQTP